MRTYNVTFEMTRKEFMDFIDGGGPLLSKMKLTVTEDEADTKAALANAIYKTDPFKEVAKVRKPRRTKAQIEADNEVLNQKGKDEAAARDAANHQRAFPWKDPSMNTAPDAA